MSRPTSPIPYPVSRRGFLYVAGLSLMFLIIAVSAVVVLQKKQDDARYAIGSDAVVLEQVLWDAESYAFFVERSVRVAQCDAVPVMAQELATRFAAADDVGKVNGYEMVERAVANALPSELQRRLEMHPDVAPSSFEFIIDGERSLLSAFAGRVVEFDARRDGHRIGVYRFSPDVTVPLMVTVADVYRVRDGLADVLRACDGRYDAQSAKEVCVSGVLKKGWSAVFPDENITVISVPLPTRCGKDVVLSVPLSVSLARKA